MKFGQKTSKFLKNFAYNDGNKPDAEGEDTRPTVKRYFKLLGRRFWKLVMLNLMMIPQVLPILIGAMIYTGAKSTPVADNVIFPQLYGANLIDHTPASASLLDLFGGQTSIPAFGAGIYIWIGVCALFLLVTFGWQNCGSTYILRSMVRGEPVFLISDYFYAVRRNLKQGFFLGALDLIIMFLLGYNIALFLGTPSTFVNNFFLFANAALAVLWFFMRFYIYLMQVTFNLSIRKILKNALIFTTLGVKRNLMGLLGIILLASIEVVSFAFLTPLGIPVAFVLPLIYFFSFTAFTSAYAAYPIIDRYMIAPYRTENDYKDSEE